MKKNTVVNLGSTLYDANKQLIKQTEQPLTHPEIGGKVEELEDFFEGIVRYAMLLCHERRDYTVFALTTNSIVAPHHAANEVIGCCTDRGSILSIEKTEDKQAYEIWLDIEGEAFCYYLFPYDKAVIEC